MINEIIFQIKQDEALYKYLKYNSHWYQILTNDPNRFKDFIDAFKKDNNLTMDAKIKDLGNKISMILSLLEVIN